MELIADGLLIAAAGTAALYCWVLSRRLTALNDLDKGLGGAIASLSAQVDETRASLAAAKSATRDQSREMQDLTRRAEAAAAKLEMILAAVQERKSGEAPGDAKGQKARARRAPASGVAAAPEAASKAEKILKELGQTGGPPAETAVSVAPEERSEPAQMLPAAPGEKAGADKSATKSALINRLRGLAQATAP
ncbi:MAG: hypothetical protein AAFY59_04345 [Pseudomonadota bacterium]